ncbi:MAG: alkaline phosphatase [Pirellulales bacterium]
MAAFGVVDTLSAAEPVKDPVREQQQLAVELQSAPWGFWGPDPSKYSSWVSHSNRLIPIYTFGIGLDDFTGKNSAYRSEDKLKEIYGRLPTDTLNPHAQYMDQTDVYRLQRKAVDEGKKRVILMIFDGNDWWSTWAAANYKNGQVGYREGRGTGLNFQDYRGVKTDYGYHVTAPHSINETVDVNAKKVKRNNKEVYGGFAWETAGETPWAVATDPNYYIGKGKIKHPYTDSSASATSMTAGIKTYNEAINVGVDGKPVDTIAHYVQKKGWPVGVVTSVPIPHATPGCAYAHNVDRGDYQDISRDLLGLPSIYHPKEPLPGVDVLIGAGHGVILGKDGEQGKNFIPGNQYLANSDKAKIDVKNGGKYTIAERTAGKKGPDLLKAAAQDAIKHKTRLLGFFGTKYGHLPFRTADGRYDPTVSIKRISTKPDYQGKAEVYTPADIDENPILADIAVAALDVLASKGDKFWLMVEAGDVDWGNHANNIDNSIGATISGDMAFTAIVEWIEKHGGWDDTALILTADHGHYLTITRPDLLLPPATANHAPPAKADAPKAAATPTTPAAPATKR